MGINWKFWAKRKSPTQLIRDPKGIYYYSTSAPVTDETAMQVSAFYRGVIYVSTQISKLPWEVKNSQNEVEESSIAYLLNVQPNPEMTSMFFRLCMIQNAIIYGDSIAEIERDLSGKPVALWPIVGRSFDVIRLTDSQIGYRILAGDGFSSSKDIYLPKEDVFHVKNFHTKDGIRGQGVVAYANDVLGISLGADRMAGGLFSNGGMPSGILGVPGSLSAEAIDRISQSWKENHSGRRAGGTAVLEEGVKYQPISMAPDVLQFLESRKFNVLEIARFLGIPPTKLFDIDAATYANMENANLEVATDTLHVWAKSLELEADIKLLNTKRTKKRSELNLYDVFKGDMTTRSSYFSKLMQQGAITPNEIRRREGMAPYEGGDRFWIAVNNYSPSDRVDEIIDSNINKGQAASTRDKPEDLNVSAELEREVLKLFKGK